MEDLTRGKKGDRLGYHVDDYGKLTRLLPIHIQKYLLLR